MTDESILDHLDISYSLDADNEFELNNGNKELLLSKLDIQNRKIDLIPEQLNISNKHFENKESTTLNNTLKNSYLSNNYNNNLINSNYSNIINGTFNKKIRLQYNNEITNDCMNNAQESSTNDSVEEIENDNLINLSDMDKISSDTDFNQNFINNKYNHITISIKTNAETSINNINHENDSIKISNISQLNKEDNFLNHYSIDKEIDLNLYEERRKPIEPMDIHSNTQSEKSDFENFNDIKNHSSLYSNLRVNTTNLNDRTINLCSREKLIDQIKNIMINSASDLIGNNLHLSPKNQIKLSSTKGIIKFSQNIYCPIPTEYITNLNLNSHSINLSSIIYEDQDHSNSSNYFNLIPNEQYSLNIKIKPNLKRNIDYLLLHEELFDLIQEEFGIDNKKYKLKFCSYINQDGFEVVEIDPLFLNLYIINNNSQYNLNIILDYFNSIKNEEEIVNIVQKKEFTFQKNEDLLVDTISNTPKLDQEVTSEHSLLYEKQILIDCASDTSSIASPLSHYYLNCLDSNYSSKNEKEDQASYNIFVSRYLTINNFLTFIQEKILKSILGENSIRIWNAVNPEKIRLMYNKEKTLEQEQISNNQLIIVEIKNEDEWPLNHVLKNSSIKKYVLCKNDRSIPKRLTKAVYKRWNSFFHYFYKKKYKSNPRLGLCGLRNLGNTCFMNASIQCLSNIEDLSNYFTTNSYREDINSINPLGMKGKLAKAYGSLIRKMWSGHSTISPIKMKRIISQFAPRFNGMRQHDAHELLMFLLDGLHEDLNLVKEKPHVELNDITNVDDFTLSDESWDAYIKRNKSVVVDIFQAQLKSSLVCSKCSYVSNRFEPYNCCSVSVPQTILRYVSVLYMHIDPLQPEFGSRPIKYSIEITERCLIGMVRKKLARLLNTSPSDFIFADLLGFTINKYLSDDDYINELTTKDKILCFKRDPSSVLIQCCQTYNENGIITPLGIPFALHLPKIITGKGLYRILAQYTQRFTYSKVNKDEDIHYFKIIMKDNPFGEYGIEISQTEQIINFSQNERTLVVDWLDSMIIALDESMTVVLDKNSTSESRLRMDLPLNIHDCFNLYTETEKLGSDNLWFCPSCNKRREAWKKVELWSLPDIFVVQIKRFVQTSPTRWDKLSMKVDFPIYNLDMGKHLVKPPLEPALFDLIAVINHSGQISSGHYTAYAKNPILKQWYLYNDNYVYSVTDLDSIISEKAYILFYKRKDPPKPSSFNLINYISNMENEVPSESNPIVSTDI